MVVDHVPVRRPTIVWARRRSAAIVATSTQPAVAVASADSCSIDATAGQMLTIPDEARPTAGHGQAADSVRDTIRKPTGKVLSDAAPSAGRRRGLDSLVAGPLTWLPMATVSLLRREPSASRRLENLVASGWLVIEERCFGRDDSQLEDLNSHLLLLGSGTGVGDGWRRAQDNHQILRNHVGREPRKLSDPVARMWVCRRARSPPRA